MLRVSVGSGPQTSTRLGDGAVDLAVSGQVVEKGGLSADQVGHGAVAARRRRIIKVLANVGSAAAQ